MNSRLRRRSISTIQAAQMLGVAVSSVAKWIDEGKLRAGRTPGGHRRIEREDLVDFLRRQKLPIPPELSPSRCRILIVDDDAGVVRLLVEELKERRPDCEVLQARDGFSAGETIGLSKPDVVILDLFMPEMDGFEVCRRIKSHPLLSRIHIIAISGHATPEVRARILEAGAACCLDKPLNIPLLVREINKVLAPAR